MAVRDQSGGGTLSDSILPGRNDISLDAVAPQLKEVATPADEYAPKSRKPYTITKQRERWTDEEHRKFLEALKLYGRAWRPIEEHVGTKTAVQIRSHAQKFFSKVVRESSNGDVSSEEPIAIPPPRPKRKPMHPYPRNLATPVESGIQDSEKRRRWRAASPNLSVSEQENQSPTSVLSALGSDAFGTDDSAMPSGSPSPVSSAAGRSSGGVVPSETANFIIPEDSPAQAHASSNPKNQACVKLELLPQDNTIVKEVSDEASSTQCLKLFGQTVLVNDSHRSSSPTSGNISSIDVNDDPASRPLHWSLVRVKSLASDAECSSSTLTIGAPKQFHYVPTQNGSPRPKESVSSPLSRWGSSYVSAASPCIEVHNPIPMKGRPFFNDSNLEDKETEKEVSSSGSNIESATAEICVEKNLDIEAQSSLHALEKAGRELSYIRPSETPNLERRANFTKRVKGFMPYKRCFAKGFVPYKRCLAERSISSLTLTSEEREEQRTRLCL